MADPKKPLDDDDRFHGQIWDDDNNPSDLADDPGCGLVGEVFGDEFGGD